MIRAEYEQTVTVAGQLLLVQGLSLRESDDEPVSQIDFFVPSDVQSLSALDALALGAELVVTQSAQGRVVSVVADITSIQVERQDHTDVYRVAALGEANRLALRRFSDIFDGRMTASQVILTAVSRHGGHLSLSTAGVMPNLTRVGEIEARQDTLLYVMDTVAKRTGWTWRVEQGVLYYQPPAAYQAPFSLRSGVNLERSGYTFNEDLGEVRNVIRAEAYEYQNVVVAKTVAGCTQTIFGPTFDEAWEFAGLARVTSPDDLVDVSVEADPFTGRIRFATPLIRQDEVPDPVPAGYDPAESQQFEVRVEYLIRRKMMLERRDEVSIALYGERHGVFRPSAGADAVESVFETLRTELERKAFPTITAKARVTDFGLRAGMLVSVVPFGRSQPVALRVSGIRHTSGKSELEVEVDLASRTYVGVDPVPELFQRVANLEKVSLDPNSVAGSVIESVGPIRTAPAIEDTWGWSDQTDVIFAGVGAFTGGGSFEKIGFAFGGDSAFFQGGGSLLMETESQVATGVSFTGSGSMTALRGAEHGEQADFTGAGSYSLQATEFPSLSLSLSGGGSMSGMRGAEHEDPAPFSGGGQLHLIEAPGYGSGPLLISGGGVFSVTAVPEDVRLTEGQEHRIAEDGTFRITEG